LFTAIKSLDVFVKNIMYHFNFKFIYFLLLSSTIWWADWCAWRSKRCCGFIIDFL